MENTSSTKPSAPRMTREQYLKLPMKERAALPAEEERRENLGQLP